MFLATDLTELPLSVRKRMHEILTQQNAMAALQAKIRQRQIARFYHNHRPKAIEGIGGLTMSVDPYWMNYWRWKLGTQVVEQDTEFKAWLRKKEPSMRVTASGTRFQVGFTGTPRRKFQKTYGQSKRPDAPGPSQSANQKSKIS